MATGLENYPRITPPDSDYPNGNLKDTLPGDPGTPVNTKVYSDIHQFFAKLLRLVGITANGLPENEYTGFQYLLALIQYVGISKKVINTGFSGSSIINCTVSALPVANGRYVHGEVSVTILIAGTATIGASELGFKISLPSDFKMKRSFAGGGISVVVGTIKRTSTSAPSIEVPMDLSDSGELSGRINVDGDIEVFDTTNQLSSSENFGYLINITGDSIGQY